MNVTFDGIMMKKISVCIGVTLMITACTELPSIEQQYQAAVQDAAIVKAKEATNQLWAINLTNPNLVWNADKTKLLVVTWKKRESYEKFIKNHQHTSDDINYALWVTAAPQVQAFCQQYAQLSDAELNLRLKQYLGLAPNWQYDVFVEMWVNPEALFRPCVDRETDDKQCQAEIPKDFTSTDYGQFYRQLYFKSFRASEGVPWTGLGYTYDWGNADNKVGASEFIVKPLSSYEVEEVQSTRAYCAR